MVSIYSHENKSRNELLEILADVKEQEESLNSS